MTCGVAMPKCCFVVVLGLLLFGSISASAVQAEEISADFIRYGLYEATDEDPVYDSEESGADISNFTYTFLETIEDIYIAKGVAFGFSYLVHGEGNLDVRYSLTTPNGKTLSSPREISRGNEHILTYNINNVETFAAGRYDLFITYGDKRVVGKTFNLLAP